MERKSIKLNENLAFVKEIKKLMLGESKKEKVVEILLDEEKKAGVSIWREMANDSKLGAGLYIPKKTTNQRISIQEFMASIENWDDFCSFYEFSDNLELEQEQWQKIYQLLSSTEIIISGMDFTNNHFIKSSEGNILAWTQRAWGALLANWANQCNWNSDFEDRCNKYSWKYIDFYCASCIENYESWSLTLFEVIKYKTQLAILGEISW